MFVPRARLAEVVVVPKFQPMRANAPGSGVDCKLVLKADFHVTALRCLDGIKCTDLIAIRSQENTVISTLIVNVTMSLPNLKDGLFLFTTYDKAS